MKLTTILSISALLVILCFSSCSYFGAGKEYKTAIESADSAFNQKLYANAKTLYNKALEIKAEEQYPKDKIAEIDKIIASQKKAKYDAHVKKADDFFNNKSYSDAKAAYGEASKVKPGEKYPKDKIAEIDKILADMQAEQEFLTYKYHIVVGCFTVPSNAVKLNAKLTEQGYKSRIIKFPNGRFDAVTCASYPDLKASVKDLQKMRSELHEEAWVYKH